MLPVVEPEQQIEQFVDYLFDGLTGYALAPTLDRNTGEFHHEWFEWPTERDKLVGWVENNAPTKEVYLAPALWKAKQLSKDNFAATNVIWTEFDGNVPSTIGSIPEPTLRVQSSSESFQHWYWKLSTPLYEVLTVEALNRSITYTLGADASSWDSTQILRVPGTTNHKRDTIVSLLARTDDAVHVSLFESVPAVPEPEVAIKPDTIPDVTDVVLKYAWPDEVISLYKVREHPVGSRSSALMRLGYYLAEMGMNDAEMFSVLRNADDRWGKFKDRRDRDQRLIDLIARTRTKFPEQVDLADTNLIPVYGFHTFLNTEIKIEWLIEGLLERQGYMLLTGPSGVGKTQFSLRFAINMALGREYLGLKVERPMRLLFVSCEMGHPALKHFATIMATEQFTEEELATLEQNLFIVPLGEPFYIDNDKGQARFEELLQTLRPDGFIFDSIGSATSGELATESVVKAIMDFNDRIRLRNNCFSWYIHHNRKATSDNKKPNKLSDVYGNQYLVNRATTVYCLWPDASGIEVIPLKKRLAALEEPWHIVRTPELDFHKKSMASFGNLSLIKEGKPETANPSPPVYDPTQNGGYNPPGI